MPAHAYTAEAVQPQRVSTRRWAGGPAAPLALAALCLLGLVLVWLIAEHVPGARLRDSLTLHDFTRLDRPGVEKVGTFLIHLLEPLVFVIWGIALVAVAIARSRPRVAIAVAAVMALAPLAAEILKPLLAHPHIRIDGLRIGAASYPSGHSTAALTLVLCVVLVTPARLRPLVGAIGALYAGAVGLSLLILAWHMPSDVIGGYLLASLCMALAVAALRAVDRRWPARGS